MVLTGQVLSQNCAPIANALIDFWHANDQGAYDNRGYTLRGHQYTDAQGRYRLETIVPGIYPGRTRHFHIKVQAANQPVLTTQLYFPGDSLNERDFLFQPELLIFDGQRGQCKPSDFQFCAGYLMRLSSHPPLPPSTCPLIHPTTYLFPL